MQSFAAGGRAPGIAQYVDTMQQQELILSLGASAIRGIFATQ